MAEGRMLKRAIADSRRLANLKTDTARLLYTWLLPFLDVEGRFSADPAVIKGHVVPRIKHIGLKTIATCLSDMAANELILLYEVDGDVYLEYRKFQDHQYLNPDREAKSRLPAPQRKSFTKEQYETAWNEWNNKDRICPQCKKKAEFINDKGWVIDGYIPFQIDHIIPITRGGSNDTTNLQILCQKCNATKGNRDIVQSPPEFLQSPPAEVNRKEVKGKELKKIAPLAGLPVDNSTGFACSFQNQEEARKWVAKEAKVVLSKGSLGAKELDQFTNCAKLLCVMVRNRWNYEQCQEEHFKRCSTFFLERLADLKEAMVKKTIRWPPEYLLEIVEAEINNHGEEWFKTKHREEISG